jgi:hypothetical protein
MEGIGAGNFAARLQRPPRRRGSRTCSAHSQCILDLCAIQADSRARPGRLPFANALALLNTLIADLAAFSGMEMENMTRGHGWRSPDAPSPP